MDDKQFERLMTTLDSIANGLLGILRHLEPSSGETPTAQAAERELSETGLPAVYISSQSPIPPSLGPTPWEKWQQARNEYGDGPIPANIMPAHGDDVGMIVLKTSALLAYTSWSRDNQAIYHEAVKQHGYVAKYIVQLKLDVEFDPALLTLDPLEELVDVEAKTTELHKLANAERRKPRQMETVEVEPVAGASGARTAMQARADILSAAARNGGMRTMDDNTRTHVYIALKSVAGEQNLHRVIGMLFGHASFKAVSSAQAWALHQWLKPGLNDAKQWAPNYPHAVAEINNLLQHTVPANAESAELEPLSL